MVHIVPIAGPSTSFHTLDREYAFSNPSKIESKYPAAQALVAPHIDSFDALFEGAPIGSKGKISSSHGLLHLAVADLLPKVIFDPRGQTNGLGNKLESEYICLIFHWLFEGFMDWIDMKLTLQSFSLIVKIDNLIIDKPKGPHQLTGSSERSIYPTEVSRFDSIDSSR